MKRTLALLATFVMLGAAVFVRPAQASALTLPDAANAWILVATAIWLQALPFLLLGVLVSAAIQTFLPRDWLQRTMPRNEVAAVPAAAAAGIMLPGCECASVPTSRQLMRSGLAPAPALTFLLAAPAINPVVIASTAVAFAGRPIMAVARFVASLCAATLIGLIWSRLDRDSQLVRSTPGEIEVDESGRSCRRFRDEVIAELLDGASYLVVGSMVAATIKTLVPTSWLAAVSSSWWLELFAFAILAVLVALCSEADAFMAASFVGFSPTAALVFMVVGPMVDVKLMAMQHGAFGPRFVARFAPLTFAICVAVAGVVGMLLL